MEGLRGRWLSFAEQASSPTSMLSGAATATAAVLLAFPFHSSFPDKVAKVSSSLPSPVGLQQKCSQAASLVDLILSSCMSPMLHGSGLTIDLCHTLLAFHAAVFMSSCIAMRCSHASMHSSRLFCKAAAS